jgi:8-oxo-dGTP diphosphatase
MMYETKPEDFNSKFYVVGCFIEHDNKIALLHRQDHKPQGNTWGIPSGKVDSGESALEAMAREIKEETGIDIPHSKITDFQKVYVRFAGYDFIYHIFHAELDEPKEIQINPEEHKDSKWASLPHALGMSLIEDLDGCIELYYKLK